jgi:hypothetical protein
MKYSEAIYLLFVMTLTSCAVQVNNVDLKRRVYDDVPLNTTLKNEIGDKLIETGEEDYQDALRIVETPDFKINSIAYTYKKGDILPLSGSTNEYFLYYNKKDVTSTYNTSYYFGIAISKKDPNVIFPFVNGATGSYGALYTKKVDGFKTKADTFVDPNCSNCYKQEFIYNGKVGASLRFIYREYINDMARPAFNQELQYDLNESSIIGFKGVRLEVVNATNTNIEYKILSPFNPKAR